MPRKPQTDKQVVRAYGADEKVRWEIEADGSGDLILAGANLIAAGNEAITIIRLPKGKQPAKIAETIPVEQQIERLIAADKKLFAVTIDGQVMAFGDGKPSNHDPGVDELPDLHGFAEGCTASHRRLACRG